MESEHGERAKETDAAAGGPPAHAADEGARAQAPEAVTQPGANVAPPAVEKDAPRADVKKPANTRRRIFLAALLALAALASTFLYVRHRRELLSGLRAGADRAKEVLTGEPSKPRDPYAEAVASVEADRGEAAGRAAQAEIPAELKQYREPRRFLAIQSAAAAEAGIRPPHDFAELAEMIRAGRDFVEAPRLGRGYVLYGVGLTATGELTHYDTRARKVVPLFAGVEELKSYTDGLAADRARIESELKDLDAQLRQVGRGERAERSRITSETAARRKELTRLKESGELVAQYYGKSGVRQDAAPRESAPAADRPAGGAKTAGGKTQGREKTAGGKKGAAAGKTADRQTADRQTAADERRAAGVGKAAAGARTDGVERAAGGANAAAESGGASKLFAEYAVLAELARDFGGRSYDLRDRESAREFQARLLSFLRPPALAVLEELGTAYQSKFERPLPATSLVRTEEYQRLLRESGNPNAADVAPPPHTTGLAFDIYYRFMTGAEQEFVMGEIARLEREGRVEALRELRDHYHVFVFPEGRRPDDKRVDKILGKPARK